MKIVSILVFVPIALALLYFALRKITANAPYEYPYVSLKHHDLEAVPDHELENRVLDHVFWHVGNKFENVRAKLQRLPLPIQYVYATWCVEAEVFNGGFNQYFFNSAGNLADIALKGYLELGLNDHAALLERAMFLNNEILEAEGKTKREYSSIEDFASSYEDNPLDDLDKEFYKLEHPAETRENYIRDHDSVLENGV